MDAMFKRGLEIDLGSAQHLNRKDFNRARLSLVIWPRADISIEKKETTRERSLFFRLKTMAPSNVRVPRASIKI